MKRGTWKPTHRIRLASGLVIDVQLVDGKAYTWAESREGPHTVYTCDEKGCWLWAGKPFEGTVNRL